MQGLTNNELFILLITILWALPWKIYALWIASKRNQKWWFVVLIAINTFGILEIFYVFYIAKKKWSDIRSALNGILPQK